MSRMPVPRPPTETQPALSHRVPRPVRQTLPRELKRCPSLATCVVTTDPEDAARLPVPALPTVSASQDHCPAVRLT